jgi:hypothetical protein
MPTDTYRMPSDFTLAEHDHVQAVLREALRLVTSRPYQSRFMASDEAGEPCSPTREGASLSMSGAILLAAGSGPKAWPVLAFLATVSCRKPGAEPSRDEAIHLLELALQRSAMARKSVENQQLRQLLRTA